jgi:glycosyltransferase involved in cell wall biosynthesis
MAIFTYNFFSINVRVALITDGVWPYVLGGMQKHSYYICKYLAKNKVHVDLFHFNDSSYDISQLEFFTVDEKKYINSILVDFPKSIKFPGHYLYNSYRHSQLIFDAIKTKLNNYDFIYTKGFTGWHLINQKKKKKITCCKIGVKFHGYEMFQEAPNIKTKLQYFFLLRKPVKKISCKADIVFSYGGKITDIIRSIGVETKKIIEMPSGIEAESLAIKIKPTQKQIKLLYLGRYERRKGVEELTNSLRRLLHEKKYDFEFHFIGNIPEEKKIEHPLIIYHGEIRERKILFDKIKFCDILICPSYSEGFPNVILEAMGNGLAVAATPVGAVELMVDSQNGWIINSPKTENILTTLKLICNENIFTIDLKKEAAIEKIKLNFLWDNLLKRLISNIESLNLTTNNN